MPILSWRATTRLIVDIVMVRTTRPMIGSMARPAPFYRSHILQAITQTILLPVLIHVNTFLYAEFSLLWKKPLLHGGEG